jgi:metal-dependent HD superfamily phosphatase/phosphodiesterase
MNAQLKALHILVPLTQLISQLQQGPVHRRIIHRTADLQCLLNMLFEPQAHRIGHGSAVVIELGHLLHAYSRQVQQAFHPLFGIVLELQTEIFAPQFQSIEWFVRQIVLCRAHSCSTTKQQAGDHKERH